MSYVVRCNILEIENANLKNEILRLERLLDIERKEQNKRIQEIDEDIDRMNESVSPTLDDWLLVEYINKKIVLTISSEDLETENIMTGTRKDFIDEIIFKEFFDSEISGRFVEVSFKEFLDYVKEELSDHIRVREWDKYDF